MKEKKGDLEKMKEYIPEGSVSERISAG